MTCALARPVCDILGIPLIGRSLPAQSNKPEEGLRALKTEEFCTDGYLKANTGEVRLQMRGNNKDMNEKPYLTKRVVDRRYNPNYGDDRVCECGRTYRQHFKSVCGTVSMTPVDIPMIHMRSPADLVPDTWGSCKRFREPKILLTGKELKFAAKHKLKVRYVEQYFNPMDNHMNFNQITVMEPANAGYYIGNSNINPNNYEDYDRISGDFPEGTFAVYKVPGVTYNDRFKMDDLVAISHPLEDYNGALGIVRALREGSRGLEVEVETETEEGNRRVWLSLPEKMCKVIDNMAGEAK